MNEVDQTYLEILNDVLENGHKKGDRTGTGTYSASGRTVRFDVSEENFPIVTLKKIHVPSLVYELLWFISGETNVNFLNERGVSIWDDWADDDGSLGPVYGYQWRNWPKYEKVTETDDLDYYVKEHIDQLQNTIDGIRENPNSRRHLVSAWNVSDLQKMNLVPCHFTFQLISQPIGDGKRKLDIVVTQRSADLFIGACFNWSSYSLLLLLISKITGHRPGEMIWNGGDVHLYQNHVEQVKRLSKQASFSLPSIEINEEIEEIDGYTYDDIHLKNYEHGPYIKAPVAV